MQLRICKWRAQEMLETQNNLMLNDFMRCSSPNKACLALTWMSFDEIFEQTLCELIIVNKVHRVTIIIFSPQNLTITIVWLPYRYWKFVFTKLNCQYRPKYSHNTFSENCNFAIVNYYQIVLKLTVAPLK